MTPTAPNLLHPDQGLCLDGRELAQALTFAFATGGTGGAFSRVFSQSRLCESSFQPESFAKDLFLSDFVNHCMSVRAGGKSQTLHRTQIVRELSHPPSDPAVIAYRQRILRELAERPELDRGAERVFRKVRELSLLLEATDRGKRYDAIGRRLDILRAVKEALELLAEAFAGASSELRRAHDFAAAAIASPAFQDLKSLLDYEGNLATVDLRVKVSYDGQLRGFEMVRASENRANPFYVSPLRRLFTRLRLLFRGYNIREAEILGRLANRVFDGVQDAVIGLMQVSLQLEFYLGALALRDRALECGLEVCLPELSAFDPAATDPSQGASELEALFNPLLLLEDKPPRPADVRVSRQALVIITGPNSGGKTRLLQALGLTQLLAQSGMFVPAKRARISVREGLFVSLIEEHTADQPEGHLGMELLRIRRLFEELSPNSLVIMDELCSGTNPSEGEEIFRLVVELLAELEPQAFITTHFLRFAGDLERERPLPGLEFLEVELDANNEPTYGFIPGVAKTSLAGRTAERLGVTREALEALVREKRRERPRAAAPAPAPGIRTTSSLRS